MNIIKYSTMLSEEVPGVNVLVKEQECIYDSKLMDQPRKVVDVLNDLFHLNRKSEEYVYMIALDGVNNIIGVFEISHGVVNASLIQPREVFIKALLCGAVGLVLAHNHPSSNCSLSNDDLQVLNRMKDAGKMMGIPLLDFLIIGGSNYFSANERGMI